MNGEDGLCALGNRARGQWRALGRPPVVDCATGARLGEAGIARGQTVCARANMGCLVCCPHCCVFDRGWRRLCSSLFSIPERMLVAEPCPTAASAQHSPWCTVGRRVRVLEFGKRKMTTLPGKTPVSPPVSAMTRLTAPVVTPATSTIDPSRHVHISGGEGAEIFYTVRSHCRQAAFFGSASTKPLHNTCASAAAGSRLWGSEPILCLCQAS